MKKLFVKKRFFRVKGSDGSDWFFNYLFQWEHSLPQWAKGDVHIFVSSSGPFQNCRLSGNKLLKVGSGYFLV